MGGARQACCEEEAAFTITHLCPFGCKAKECWCFLFIFPPTQINVADFQDNQWVTCFQESAETILGQNAAYLGELKEKVSRLMLLICSVGRWELRGACFLFATEVLTC